MSKTLITLQSRLVDAVQGKKDRGATMVEYGLIVALIAVVVAVAAATLGTDIASLFGTVSGKL
ncbi:Flp family type IVb pilin [Flexivirga alba]|uniref:Flp family type IVb pilin n=1 Tax=Flexivirga alba TaxID=702742 RepID=A0ABW2AB36_9MICO